MENIKPKRKYIRKIKTEPIVPTENIVIPPPSSLINNTDNEKNVYKYTKHGAIRQSWIRDEAKREKAGNNDIIAIKVKEELLRLEQKKLKEDERERVKQQKMRDSLRLREEKKAKMKSERVDMRGKTEKALAHNKAQGSRLQQGIYMKMKKKEEERRKKYPDSDDSDNEEITTTTIRRKRSCSKTPEIDYRRFYEDSIKKKTIKEDEEKTMEDSRNNSRSQSPHISHIRSLQRNIFKGIL